MRLLLYIATKYFLGYLELAVDNLHAFKLKLYHYLCTDFNWAVEHL